VVTITLHVAVGDQEYRLIKQVPNFPHAVGTGLKISELPLTVRVHSRKPGASGDILIELKSPEETSCKIDHCLFHDLVSLDGWSIEADFKVVKNG
jgi:hypothetical protein